MSTLIQPALATPVSLANGGFGASNASIGAARTTLGSTTVGDGLFTATNPSAVTFVKVAADNTVSFRTASQLLGDIGGASNGANGDITALSGITGTITGGANALLNIAPASTVSATHKISELEIISDSNNFYLHFAGATYNAFRWYNPDQNSVFDGSVIEFRYHGSAYLLIDSSGLTARNNLAFANAGQTVSLKSGSNAKAGTFTLTAGTVTVSNTSVTANSVICCTVKTASGTLGTGTPEIVISAGVGFTATGIATDASTYNFIIFEVN